MLLVLIPFSISGIKRYHKRSHLKNHGDIVSLEQFQRIGWNTLTWDSIDELNRAFHSFGVTDRESVQKFVALCTFASECGTILVGKGLRVGQIEQIIALLRGKFGGEDMRYTGAGYLLSGGKDNYSGFSNFIGDKNILNIGAHYVAKHYPWAFALYTWKKDRTTYDSFVNSHLWASKGNKAIQEKWSEVYNKVISII